MVETKTSDDTNRGHGQPVFTDLDCQPGFRRPLKNAEKGPLVPQTTMPEGSFEYRNDGTYQKQPDGRMAKVVNAAREIRLPDLKSTGSGRSKKGPSAE